MSEFTLSQIIEALSEPFPSNEVEFKPGATNREKTKALALAYVDSRSYIQRLNLVCPEWQDDYQITMLPDRVVVLCRLTIAGVTRTGDGECLLSSGEEGERTEANAVTSASAQAFKRACVKFGLGAYLYALPQVWCDYDHAKRKIVNPPQLPDWALPAGEWTEKRTQAAVQRVAAEGFVPEPDPVPASAPAPQPEAQVQGDIGDFIVPEAFKKHAGLKLRNIPRSSIEWYANMDARTPPARALQAAARAFLDKYPA